MDFLIKSDNFLPVSIADYKQLACVQVIDFFRVIDLELEINQFSKYDGLNFEICQHR